MYFWLGMGLFVVAIDVFTSILTELFGHGETVLLYQHLISIIIIMITVFKLYQFSKARIEALNCKYAEVSLGKSEAERAFDSVIKSMPCALSVISPQFEILSVNDSLVALADSSQEELLGKKCFDIFCQGKVPRECAVRRAFRTKRMRQSDRQEHHVAGKQLYIRQAAIPVLSNEGKVKYAVEAFIDITQEVRAKEEKEQLLFDVIASLSQALDSRDDDTGAHSINVRNIALEIGDWMDLAEETMEELAITALLHDIGKIGIPDSIIRKIEPLTSAEFDIIKKHSEIGYETLARIKSLKVIANNVLYHHEKFDGTGYPHGLKGRDIPLIARIIAVADVWDALNNDRPYRKAYNFNAALQYMMENKGTHFDPDIIEIFFEVTSLYDERVKAYLAGEDSNSGENG